MLHIDGHLSTTHTHIQTWIEREKRNVKHDLMRCNDRNHKSMQMQMILLHNSAICYVIQHKIFFLGILQSWKSLEKCFAVLIADLLADLLAVN